MQKESVRLMSARNISCIIQSQNKQEQTWFETIHSEDEAAPDYP